MKLDPELQLETLVTVGESFFSGWDFERLDAPFVAQVARAFQGWKVRKQRR